MRIFQSNPSISLYPICIHSPFLRPSNPNYYPDPTLPSPSSPPILSYFIPSQTPSNLSFVFHCSLLPTPATITTVQQCHDCGTIPNYPEVPCGARNNYLTSCNNHPAVIQHNTYPRDFPAQEGLIKIKQYQLLGTFDEIDHLN